MSISISFKPLLWLFLSALFIPETGCIKQFTPQVSQDQDLIVVEGLITDRAGPQFLKLSTSIPLGVRSQAKPLTGCNVTISDDLGDDYILKETAAGTYSTDSAFQGVAGRSYSLHIHSNESRNFLNYQSSPVLMRPVPAIDSIFYEKRVFPPHSPDFLTSDGCQVYLSTHDPEKNCKFYRWEYVETWEFRLPYSVPNYRCWVSGNSDKIYIKSTSSLTDDRIERFPINFISNATDRLAIKYSMLVNQYSISENEYLYWDKLSNIVEQVGSIYDITPASIPGNITCVEKPDETVLGYFSVSSVKSRRIFIQELFRGMPDLYSNCENVVVGYNDSIPGLNTSVWVIIANRPIKVLTYFKGCADCTDRGTKIEPDFWKEGK